MSAVRSSLYKYSCRKYHSICTKVILKSDFHITGQLVETHPEYSEITENPYFQYFIGLLGVQTEAPFVTSLLVESRKRLTDDILGEINEMIISYNTPDDPGLGSGSNPDADTSKTDTDENAGTMILDATCAPQNISFPQDVNLLNEASENMEGIACDLCRSSGHCAPRMYRRNARKDYLNLARCKKRAVKNIRNMADIS